MKKSIYLFIALLFAGAVSMAQTPCQASFTYQVSGLTVSFTDASTSSYTLTSWLWNFGDSQTSTSQNPAHTYAAAGTYYVCLTITDSHGCHNTSCQHVTVGVPHPCHASFTFTVDSTGMTYSFTNTSTGTTSTTIYTWDFGDNTTSNLESPTHTYTSAGHYLVCLYITDVATGCHSHYCINIHPNHFHHHPHHPHYHAHHNPHHNPHHHHPHKEFLSSQSSDENLSIYPNPVTDVLSININNASDESGIIRLTDVTGKVIYSQQLQLKTGENNFSIPIRAMNVESGIYFLTVRQLMDQNVTTRKVVIQ